MWKRLPHEGWLTFLDELILRRVDDRTAGQQESISMRFCWRKARAAFSLALAVLLFTGMAVAQEFRGTISGAVTDPTGAVVPGGRATGVNQYAVLLEKG